MRGACPTKPMHLVKEMSDMAPSITNSTREERLAYVREHYHCISNCDLCGLCKIFHGQDAEHALEAYIDGSEELRTVMMSYRHR